MRVNYNINPLGGFRPGAALQNLGDQFREQGKQADLKSQREQMQGLILKARQGDSDAMDQVFALNPGIGMEIDNHFNKMTQEKGVAQAKIIKKKTLDWATQWKSADMDQREMLKEQAFLDENIDFGEDEQNLTNEQFDDATNFMLHKEFKGGKTAGQREFSNLLDIAQNPNSTEVEKSSALVKLGQVAKKTSTGKERILEDDRLSDLDVSHEADIAGAREGEKLKSQIKLKPKIMKAVKLAEKAAIERGEVLTDLGRMNAALPGLTDAIGQLRQLAPLVTSTMSGKLFDAAVKEFGFGATKGSTARAKFRAIIDNQVLPLLKPTFGAAFTVPEGDALRATMGDPDATADEKLAQLDAFMDQKRRDIETKQNQLEGGQPQVKPIDQITPEQLKNMTPEQLQSLLNQGQ